MRLTSENAQTQQKILETGFVLRVYWQMMIRDLTHGSTHVSMEHALRLNPTSEVSNRQKFGRDLDRITGD